MMTTLLASTETGSPGYDELGPTEAPQLAGDHADDDGTAIDDTLTPSPDGIDYEDAPRETDPYAGLTFTEDGPVVCTRIIQNRIPLGMTDVQLVLPRDEYRVHLIIVPESDCRFASSKTDISSSMMPNLPGGMGVVLDKHTGSVWVGGGTVGTYFNVWAVTK